MDRHRPSVAAISPRAPLGFQVEDLLPRLIYAFVAAVYDRRNISRLEAPTVISVGFALLQPVSLCSADRRYTPMAQVAGEDNVQPDRLLALHGDVVYCSHVLKVEEPVAEYPVRIPVAPEVARQAMDLVRQFPGCFWFWKEEPSISFRDDVESVIRNLRQYGDKSAWSAAQELRQCL